MALAFTRGMSPLDRRLFPVMLLGRRPGRRPLRRDWFRIADRLAVGMSPQAAALPEGGDAAMVEALLEREEFRGLVEAAADCLAEPADVARRQLVMLARQTLERAMAWDDDPKAALFVLEEDAAAAHPPRRWPTACSRPVLVPRSHHRSNRRGHRALPPRRCDRSLATPRATIRCRR